MSGKLRGIVQKDVEELEIEYRRDSGAVQFYIRDVEVLGRVEEGLLIGAVQRDVEVLQK